MVKALSGNPTQHLTADNNRGLTRTQGPDNRRQLIKKRYFTAAGQLWIFTRFPFKAFNNPTTNQALEPARWEYRPSRYKGITQILKLLTLQLFG